MPGIIDCDVHEALDQRGLDDHTDPVWQGWHPIIPPLPYRLPGGRPETGADLGALKGHLDTHGVDVAILAGTIHPGNAVTQFEYHSAFTRAYNDWLASAWLDADPRLYGSVQVMSQLPGEAAREIERAAVNPKMVQVLLPARGGEGYGLQEYRPMLRAAAEAGLVVAIHSSASTRTAVGFGEHLAEWDAGQHQSFMGQLSSLCFSGVFDELPSLRVLFLGGGWTWVPYILWTMDSNYRPLRAEVPWLQHLPSEFFPEHIRFGVTPLPSGAPTKDLLSMIEMSGSQDWLVWASHFPHHGAQTPSVLDGFPDELKRKILRDNALDLYGARLAAASSS